MLPGIFDTGIIDGYACPDEPLPGLLKLTALHHLYGFEPEVGAVGVTSTNSLIDAWLPANPLAGL